MNAVNTARLTLRWATEDDAPFMLGLLNEPSFHQHIGDRGVRTEDQARQYIRERFQASYRDHGFGLYLTELRESGTPVGICGLVKRPELDDVDVGFAFVPAYWGKGFAEESGRASLEHGWRDCGLTRIVAITSDDNIGSIRVLEKIGLRFERMIVLDGDDKAIRLYAIERPPST